MIVYSNKDVIEGAYTTGGRARILLMGPPKSGKTTAAALTSPRPVFIINTEKGGLVAPARIGAAFDAADALLYRDLMAVVKNVQDETRGSRPAYETVVLDSYSHLCKALETELPFNGGDGDRALWLEYDRRLERIMTAILALPVHVVVTCHADFVPGSGAVPGVRGNRAKHLPRDVQDWVWLEVTPPRDGQALSREFLLAPQGEWKHATRSAHGVERMEANVTAFIHRFVHVPKPRAVAAASRVTGRAAEPR